MLLFVSINLSKFHTKLTTKQGKKHFVEPLSSYAYLSTVFVMRSVRFLDSIKKICSKGTPSPKFYAYVTYKLYLYIKNIY